MNIDFRKYVDGPGARDRPGFGNWQGADARLYERRGVRSDTKNRQGDFLFANAKELVVERRNKRPFPSG